MYVMNNNTRAKIEKRSQQFLNHIKLLWKYKSLMDVACCIIEWNEKMITCTYV